MLGWSEFKIYLKFSMTKAVINIIAGINQNQNSVNQYIIGHYNSSVWIIDLVSQEKLFMAILFYSQNFCQKSADRKSPTKYFSYFVLMFGLVLEPWLYV